MPLVDEAFWTDPGPFALQAAIAALHCNAKTAEQTDCAASSSYSLLERLQPSPVIALNRAAAVAMADGPDAGLGLMDELATSGVLNDYHLFHAARADLLRRAGSFAEASESYARALSLVGNDSELCYLERRLREVSSDEAGPMLS